MTREEAIQIIRETYHTDEEMKALESLIPELRESEDEKVRALLVSLVQWAEIFPQSGLDSDTTNKMLSYLEKQKEQKPADYCSVRDEFDLNGNLKQNPAKWSEEDERILKGIIGKIDHDQTYGVSKAEMLSFLKSLRTQHRWKPSEEQMSMLRAVINDPNNSGAESCQIALRGIYEQLKKL